MIYRLYELENFRYRKINLGTDMKFTEFTNKFKNNVGVAYSGKKIKDYHEAGKNLIDMGLTDKDITFK